MRCLFCFLFSFHALAWAQSRLPVSTEMPYCKDSIAAHQVMYIVVTAYDPENNNGKMTSPSEWDSIAFKSNGEIIGNWEKTADDSAYVPVVTICDSTDNYHYTRCDSLGHVALEVNGQDSWNYSYNSRGDVVRAVWVNRPAESAENIWITDFTYDSLGRPLYSYQRNGHLGWNWSTSSVDTTILHSSYTGYVYANGVLIEIQNGLDSIADSHSGSREKYFYSGTRLVRVEYSTDSERKRKPPVIHTVWLIRYGYRDE